MTYVMIIYHKPRKSWQIQYNISRIKYSMKWCEIAEGISQTRLGYHPSVLNYPYRVKTNKGKIKLIKDPSKGLKK